MKRWAGKRPSENRPLRLTDSFMAKETRVFGRVFTGNGRVARSWSQVMVHFQTARNLPARRPNQLSHRDAQSPTIRHGDDPLDAFPKVAWPTNRAPARSLRTVPRIPPRRLFRRRPNDQGQLTKPALGKPYKFEPMPFSGVNAPKHPRTHEAVQEKCPRSGSAGVVSGSIRRPSRQHAAQLNPHRVRHAVVNFPGSDVEKISIYFLSPNGDGRLVRPTEVESMNPVVPRNLKRELFL